jgi:hypothetical protein
MLPRNPGGSSTKVVLIILAIVGGVLLACGGGMAIIIFIARSALEERDAEDRLAAEKVARRFIEDLGNGRIEVAYTHATQDFRARNAQQYLAGLSARYPMLKEGDRLTFSSQNDNPGQVSVTAKRGEGGHFLTLKAVKVESVWKIAEISFSNGD